MSFPVDPFAGTNHHPAQPQQQTAAPTAPPLYGNSAMFGAAASGGYTRKERWDKDIPWFQPTPMIQHLFRCNNKLPVVKLRTHWISAVSKKGQQSKEVEFPMLCSAIDLHTGQMNKDRCYACRTINFEDEQFKHLAPKSQYLMTILLRASHASPAMFKPYRMPPTVFNKLGTLINMNTHVIQGQTYAVDLGDQHYGRDICLMYDPSAKQPENKYITMLGSHTALTEQEMQGFQQAAINFASLITMPTEEEVKQAVDRWVFKTSGPAGGHGNNPGGRPTAADITSSVLPAAPQPPGYGAAPGMPTAPWGQQPPAPQPGYGFAPPAPPAPQAAPQPPMPSQQPGMFTPPQGMAPQQPSGMLVPPMPGSPAAGSMPPQMAAPYMAPPPPPSMQVPPPPMAAIPPMQPPMPGQPMGNVVPGPGVLGAPPQAVAAPVAQQPTAGRYKVQGRAEGVTGPELESILSAFSAESGLAQDKVADRGDLQGLKVLSCFSQYKGNAQCMRCPVRQSCILM